MHVLYKWIRNLNIPTGLQLYLSDHVILAKALYGYEIWGFEYSQIIENSNNDFLRQIVNFRKSISIYILHAELERQLTQINIKSRMISFWLSVVNGKESKLSQFMYTIMLKEQEKGLYDFKWIRCINDILVSVGRPDLLRKSYISNPKALKLSILRAVSDLYIQEWNEKVKVSSTGKQYYICNEAQQNLMTRFGSR